MPDPTCLRVAVPGLQPGAGSPTTIAENNGTALHRTGTLFNGYPVDLPAIHNACNSGSERDLTADVGWTPTLHTKIDSAETADREVAHGAGPGRIP
ncbi:hypothetical protein GCM10010276_59450 [Streptomyces longisporus]|uniref:Uncharacterized protein n=1 Tax=Streptomyces longisporus TaxID=1948 RepID=A0ABP5ZZP2_STRLO